MDAWVYEEPVYGDVEEEEEQEEGESQITTGGKGKAKATQQQRPDWVDAPRGSGYPSGTFQTQLGTSAYLTHTTQIPKPRPSFGLPLNQRLAFPP